MLSKPHLQAPHLSPYRSAGPLPTSPIDQPYPPSPMTAGVFLVMLNKYMLNISPLVTCQKLK